MVALPLLVWLAPNAVDWIKGLGFFEEVPDETVTELPVDLTEVQHRIDGLFHETLRLDTNTIALEVRDVESNAIIYSRNSHRLAPPASCMKLLTAVGAMHYLGTDYNFVSQVILKGRQFGETFHGKVRIVLADDPMIESLEPFVDAICQQGIRRIEGELSLEMMRTDTLRAHASAEVWDIPYSRLPILLKGEPRVKQDLQYWMALKGLKVENQTVTDEGEERIAYRHETPLSEVLAPMLIHSSNIKADALFGHLWRISNRLPMSDFSEDWWVRPMLHRMGVDESDGFVVNDGSGLSPDNRLTAHALVDILQYAWQQEDMRHILLDKALATPGFSKRHGSLLGRMTSSMFLNRVFVKTGTLTNHALSSLAGYVRNTDDRWFSFAVINEDSPVGESRIFQDNLCRELVR